MAPPNPNAPSSTGLRLDTGGLLTGTSCALSKIGRHVTSAAFDLSNVLKQARANPSAPKWFRVVAIDASGRRAWTNPIWIDELAGG
jgi:hypothetical protein